MSKAVMPQSVGGVLLSALTAHQIASEVARSWEKVPKALGSRPTISLGSDSDLDNREDCDMYVLPSELEVHMGLEGKGEVLYPMSG